MQMSFRQFMKGQRFSTLREDEAAPVGGAVPPSPSNPDDKTNAHHFDALQQQLGIGDDEMTAALEGDPIQVWKVPDYSSKWGFLVIGPVSAIAKKRKDGNFDITFQLKEKQLMEPKSFIRPYGPGMRPLRYEGKVEDQTETITAEELQDIMAMPLMGGGAPMGMGGGPMGGMGAGAPPMMGGAPAGGGAPMGAPPMGGI